MTNKAVDVAVVGARALVGEAIIDYLAERDFPIGRLYPVEPGSGHGSITFKGGRLGVDDLDGFDFSQARLVLFATDAALATDFIPLAIDAGCIVIDGSGASSLEEDIPLVVPSINPEAIADFETRRVIASPSATTVLLAETLEPARSLAGGLERITVVSFEPVSARGRSGVEELASQTAKLLNAQPLESGIFSRQVAFNLLPQIGAAEGGATWDERALAEGVKRLFAAPELVITATAVQVPVFFGAGLAVHIAAEMPLEPERFREGCQQSGFEVRDNPDGSDSPTPVTDAANSDAIFIGRIRGDAAGGLDLWVVGDNVRRGQAMNCVAIAEILVRDYL